MTRAISAYARLGLRDTDFISLPFHRLSGGCVYWQFFGRDPHVAIPGVKASVEVIQVP
jgi:hypothetical protein